MVPSRHPRAQYDSETGRRDIRSMAGVPLNKSAGTVRFDLQNGPDLIARRPSSTRLGLTVPGHWHELPVGSPRQRDQSPLSSAPTRSDQGRGFRLDPAGEPIEPGLDPDSLKRDRGRS